MSSLLSIPLLLLSLLPTALPLPTIPLPPPPGPYNTTMTVLPLTDNNRTDPYAATRQPRRLMISIFNPVSPSLCHPILAPYMPPLTAAYYDSSFSSYGLPNGTFEAFQLSVCDSYQNSTTIATTSKEDYPVALFSPGLGTSRLIYSAIAQQVASYGYTVITIDHPYDTPIIEYLDNTTILGNTTLDNTTPDSNASRADIDMDVAVRTQDVLFVYQSLDDLLGHPPSPPLNSSGNSTQATRKVAMFGHSLGGATALSAVQHAPDSILGGMNWDGSFQGPEITTFTHAPFAQFSHTNSSINEDCSLEVGWDYLLGYKVNIELADSLHDTFSDATLWVDVLGLVPEGAPVPPVLASTIGTLGKRAIDVIAAYTAAFLGLVVGDQRAGLLAGPNAEYPEVTFITKDV